MNARRPVVLLIAGSDSSGGAGLVRDVRTLADFGADALCVVTAVTAQSDRRVLAVHPIPAAIIRAEIEGAIETHPPDAIKVGMLANRETVETVAAALMELVIEVPLPPPLVLDPVLVASSGGALLDDAGRSALKETLLPRAALLTPNVPEALALLGGSSREGEPGAQGGEPGAKGGEPRAQGARAAANGRALDELSVRLLDLGPRAVLLKGGHAVEAQAVDRLALPGEAVRRITAPRVPAAQRGTGCALASAIAAQLAAGVPLEAACRRAQAYIGARLRAMAGGR